MEIAKLSVLQIYTPIFSEGIAKQFLTETRELWFVDLLVKENIALGLQPQATFWFNIGYPHPQSITVYIQYIYEL